MNFLICLASSNLKTCFEIIMKKKNALLIFSVSFKPDAIKLKENWVKKLFVAMISCYLDSDCSMLNLYYLPDHVLWGHFTINICNIIRAWHNKMLHYNNEVNIIRSHCKFSCILATADFFSEPSEREKFDDGDTLRTWYLHVRVFIKNCC